MGDCHEGLSSKNTNGNKHGDQMNATLRHSVSFQTHEGRSSLTFMSNMNPRHAGIRSKLRYIQKEDECDARWTQI